MNFSFRFSHIWLEDESFKDLIRSFWAYVEQEDGESVMELLVIKLSGLKRVVIKWEMEKKKVSSEELVQIEEEIELIYQTNYEGVFTQEELDDIYKIKERKVVLLRYEE